jgi:two-component system sensor histidine kinase BaeS
MRPSFGITSKLFVVLFALSIVVALAMGAAVRWRFDANFLEYVNTREAERMTVLASGVEAAYAEHGNWEFLRNDRQAWFRMLRREGARARANGMGREHLDPPPGRHFDPLPPDMGRGMPAPPMLRAPAACLRIRQASRRRCPGRRSGCWMPSATSSLAMGHRWAPTQNGMNSVTTI